MITTLFAGCGKSGDETPAQDADVSTEATDNSDNSSSTEDEETDEAVKYTFSGDVNAEKIGTIDKNFTAYSAGIVYMDENEKLRHLSHQINFQFDVSRRGVHRIFLQQILTC